MAFSINKITLIGSLGKDAKTKAISDSSRVTKFSIATKHSYKNKNGDWTNETTWHNIVYWNLSDYYLNQLKKGSKVFIEGRFANRSYQDNQGNTKYISEVLANQIIPIDKKENSGSIEIKQDNKSSDDNLPDFLTKDYNEDDFPF
ncbi:MAG: single-stranded DNA-binding protein [Melioribacteraceae bacterium]|nr:single-stranded DNA-binding protein [Melioribacteraceae bacterium]